jgi:sugar lactone lactonase YvrE
MDTGRSVATGLGFLEAPRWHDNKLWFSDFYSRRVCSLDETGSVVDHLYVAGQPSGLGFLKDGSLLVVSTHDRHLLHWSDGESELIADVGSVYRGGLNDMVVDQRGRAYISTFPPPLTTTLREGADGSRLAAIMLVDERGSVRTVAEQLQIANGMVISTDGRTLIVAETLGNRLLAYAIQDDGSLSGRSVFADLGERKPDGICMDSDGHIWVGSFATSEFVLVAEGGEVLRTIPTPGHWAVACALGGTNGKTLYGLTAKVTIEDFLNGRGTGTIMAYDVDSPAA